MRKEIVQCVEAVLVGARQATKYISEQKTVKATIHGRHDRRQQIIMLVTIGRPNFCERKFIKLAKKAGEPFPIKKIQIKWPKTKEK
jgi:predicted pyridoxine 5'-phosphate oxidase superfamily flavin-nucleotide-binding protein